ncbi:MAG: HD domain-containing protein [Deltaproteobacteria bacterium]|nr:HD domain-containing protein [Deltaproteobacteria bacterium]
MLQLENLKLLHSIVSKTLLFNSLPKDISCYVVGGAVRDCLLGKPFGCEIDLITNEFDRVVSTLRNKFTLIQLSDKFGTVRIRSGKIWFDISKIFGSVIEDLSLRDFTINALALDLSNCELIDPLGAKFDLENRVLRPVSSHAIKDDPLRILRAARFGPGQAFSVSKPLNEEVISSRHLLSSIPAERIGQEFQKICAADHPYSAFCWLDEMEILDELFPPWRLARGFQQNEFHIEDVAKHTLTVLKRADDLAKKLNFQKSWKELLIASAFFHDIKKPECFTIDKSGKRRFFNHEYLAEKYVRQTLKKFSLEKDFVEAVAMLVKLHMRPLNCGPSGARRILRETNDLYPVWRALKIADKPPVQSDDEFEEILASFDKLVEQVKPKEVKMFKFDGETLKKLGFVEGKALGRTLRSLKFKASENPEYDSESFVAIIASRFKKI